MTVKAQDLKNIAPEFCDKTPQDLERFLSYAALSVDAVKWGSLTDLATLYLAAHLLSISKNGDHGPVTSETVGDLSQSYASGDATDNLMMTGYGREFLRLRRSLVITPLVVC